MAELSAEDAQAIVERFRGGRLIEGPDGPEIVVVPSAEEIDTAAKRARSAFWNETGDGWSDLSEGLKNKWRAAARAVLDGA